MIADFGLRISDFELFRAKVGYVARVKGFVPAENAEVCAGEAYIPAEKANIAAVKAEVHGMKGAVPAEE